MLSCIIMLGAAYYHVVEPEYNREVFIPVRGTTLQLSDNGDKFNLYFEYNNDVTSANVPKEHMKPLPVILDSCE